MKQTAIEWLISEWLKLDSDYYIGNIGRIEYREKRNQKHNEAKEMQKQQIKNAFEKGFITTQWDKTKENKAEQYYNETFE
jgi:hypothetical protein